jgi:hypothetical protein
MHGHLNVKFDYPTRINQESIGVVKIEAKRKVGCMDVHVQYCSGRHVEEKAK